MGKMNRGTKVSIILTVIMVLFMIPMFGFTAKAATSGDYEYEVKGGKATITKYIGNGNTIVIPSTLGGYSVVGIGEFAFYKCSSATGITIPTSVTSIDESAFAFCYNLKEFKLASGPVTDSFQVANGVLYTRSFVALISYPCAKTETSYGTQISTMRIGEYAFAGAKNLTSINVGFSVKTIGNTAFLECSNLQNINTPPYNKATNSVFDSIDGVLFSKDGTVLIQYPAGKTETSYTIPDGVTTIDPYAFYECDNLTSITIPSSVTKIDDNAFVNSNKALIITSKQIVKAKLSYTTAVTASPVAGGKVTGGRAYVQNENVTLTATPNLGYTFDGWYENGKKINGANVIYTFKITAKRTLQARFNRITHINVNFKVNGGRSLSAAEKTKKVACDASYGSLPTPKRKDYKFVGWYTQEKGGIQIQSTSKVTVKQNQTLYARWKRVKRPERPSKLTLTNKKSKQIDVSYKKVTGAEWYEITYADNRNFKNKIVKKTKGKNKSAVLKKGVQKGKTYYVKVRAYKKDSTGAKVYGKYSKKQQIKVGK